MHVADQPRHFSLLGTPWKNSHGGKIRIQKHIRFLNSHESFNRRTVKHAFIIQRFFKLAGCHGNIFHISEKIRKLKTDKFHIFLFCQPQNIFLCVIFHNRYLHANRCRFFLVLFLHTPYSFRIWYIKEFLGDMI